MLAKGLTVLQDLKEVALSKMHLVELCVDLTDAKKGLDAFLNSGGWGAWVNRGV